MQLENNVIVKSRLQYKEEKQQLAFITCRLAQIARRLSWGEWSESHLDSHQICRIFNPDVYVSNKWVSQTFHNGSMA